MSITDEVIVPLTLLLGELCYHAVFTNVTWSRLDLAGGLFTMIFFLGCDIAKTKMDISLVDERGIEQWIDIVANDELAIATVLLTIIGAYPDDELVCVVEATGCFHLALAETCHSLGLPCRIYNPIITKQQIKATVRGKKTDKTDALMIARLGLRGEGRLYTPEPYKATKHYVRSYQKLSILNSSFGQYKKHISELLDGELSDDTKELLEGIQQAIKQARRQIYKDTAASAQGDIFSVLLTVPGVGPYIAASLIGEIQDMKRFDSAKALVAYAGLDPKIRQSGKSLNSTGKLTKRGSSYLRRNIFIAAGVARQHDTQFRALYDKKRAEGKNYTTATCVVARKLLVVTRSVWLSGKTYVLPKI
jgi:transposase